VYIQLRHFSSVNLHWGLLTMLLIGMFFVFFGCSMTADIKYIRDMFCLLPVSEITVCRRHGFLRKYRDYFSWAVVIMHANDATDACV